MRTICALVLVALLQGTPADEYKTKLAALNKSTAAKHYAIGEYLAGASMFLWARDQFYKTVEFDPDQVSVAELRTYSPPKSIAVFRNFTRSVTPLQLWVAGSGAKSVARRNSPLSL